MVRHAVRAIVDILKMHKNVLGWYSLYVDNARFATLSHINHEQEFMDMVEIRVSKKDKIPKDRSILEEITCSSLEELEDKSIRMVIWESGSIKIDGIYKKLEMIEGIERLSMHDTLQGKEGKGGYRYLEFAVYANNEQTHRVVFREINRL